VIQRIALHDRDVELDLVQPEGLDRDIGSVGRSAIAVGSALVAVLPACEEPYQRSCGFARRRRARVGMTCSTRAERLS
jgi:hypothetical protein